jgi:hypothetical protein
MRGCVVGAAAVIACAAASMSAPPALAAVDLVLAPEAQTVPLGTTVDIGLYAVSNGAAQQSFSAMEVVLTWDHTALELLVAIHNGPHAWTMSGFMSDEQLDGLNNSLLDGNALYQALSINSASATRSGLLVVTLRFRTLANVDLSRIVIEPRFGKYSRTQVFGTAEPNQDVTGALGSARVTIADAVLAAADLLLPAGRIGEVVVSGEIAGQSTFGVTVVVALVPRAGAVGTVTFTPAPPVDIRELGDPWPGVGRFDAYDTDRTFSLLLNGSGHDNGTYVPGPVTFAGALAAFPVTATADARGVWDVKLTGPEEATSLLEGLASALLEGTVTVVMPGDGDGRGTTDIRDFAELEACFTGPVGPADPPVYSDDPALRCRAYDFNDDGDVDAADFAAFAGQMSGPVR